MISIVGIDAAWTSTEPSGVALIGGEPEAWRVIYVAPSYDSFIAAARGESVDWRCRKFTGCEPDVQRLLSAATQLSGVVPSLVALDMPVATQPFSARRASDQAVSLKFGRCGCSTHSPGAIRPGLMGSRFMADLAQAGYPLITSEHPSQEVRGTVEVFPHPALLTLLNRDYRVPYKVSKSAKYWKSSTVRQRISHLISEFDAIDKGLRGVFGDSLVPLPAVGSIAKLSELKRYEDALDALVCAWVGSAFMEGSADGYGDSLSTIWIPRRHAK